MTQNDFNCACGVNDWKVVQTSLVTGYVICQQCDTRVVFDLVTIQYSA